jgi:hypothetical protein
MFRGLSRADDSNSVGSDLGMNDVEKAPGTRVTNQDEPRGMQAVRVIRSEVVIECGLRFFERNAVFFEVLSRLFGVPRKAHGTNVLQ